MKVYTINERVVRAILYAIVSGGAVLADGMQEGPPDPRTIVLALVSGASAVRAYLDQSCHNPHAAPANDTPIDTPDGGN